MIILDTNILYELSYKGSIDKQRIITNYLRTENKFTNLISFLELTLEFSPIESRKIIIDHDISVVTPFPESSDLDKKSNEYFRKIASSEDSLFEFQKALKEKLDEQFQKSYQIFTQIMLSVFSYSAVFSHINNPTLIDVKNYEHINIFIKDNIPNLIKPFIENFFLNTRLEKSKSLNSSLNSITLAFSIYLDILLFCNKNQIDYLEYLKANPDIINLNKEYIFSKKIKKYTKENQKNIKDMYSQKNSIADISLNYITDIILEYITNNRQIRMNDILDAMIISSIKNYRLLTFDNKMLDFLRKHDQKSFQFSIKLKKLTNCA
ncbi:hypothetical protein JWG40_12225 [Leptospira sp. 201903074]|uniref:hypothetical protein n=1 Tax=Leptospira abararensis TaxID=2810036 RepID=UPI0019643D03|nr:hypothetical protein [Leptospira abararensis]MBM9547790.1 hypothetical protein [Leptospira abararensis]